MGFSLAWHNLRAEEVFKEHLAQPTPFVIELGISYVEINFDSRYLVRVPVFQPPVIEHFTLFQPPVIEHFTRNVCAYDIIPGIIIDLCKNNMNVIVVHSAIPHASFIKTPTFQKYSDNSKDFPLIYMNFTYIMY